MPNKHGLPRNIPDPIKRDIRIRSKFGCVICRAGIYDYEHIDPEYSSAKIHKPDDICCLCNSCHAKVTRGHFSKDYVRKQYIEISQAKIEDIRPPFDKLDFHDGRAELKIGGISYDPGLNTIVNYEGQTIFSISPSNEGEAARLNALFLDRDGHETLRIVDNVWHGATSSWDTEVVGPRIKVRKKKGEFSLILRLDPPGRIVIEKLDMRVADAHILASEHSYAIGRYIKNEEIYWFHAKVTHIGSPLLGASAIEFVTPQEAYLRDRNLIGRGQRLATPDNDIVLQTGLGVAHKSAGIIIGANCLRFRVESFASGGHRPINNVRNRVFYAPDKLSEYISTGKF